MSVMMESGKGVEWERGRRERRDAKGGGGDCTSGGDERDGEDGGKPGGVGC